MTAQSINLLTRKLLIGLAVVLFTISINAGWVLVQQSPTNAPPARATLTILGTTDLHGNIDPIDYFTDTPANRGLAKVFTLVKQVRRQQPNTLLIDSGDCIQGTPLVYYHNVKNPTPAHPMMLVMSYMGYDGMAVGNHEFNFGLHIIEKARREVGFPWLSANTYRTADGSNYFTPTIVREVAGVRVGILGLTTPAIPTWENPENYAGLEFRNPVEEARRWVPILREKERCDIVVVAVHMGLDRDLTTGKVWPQDAPGDNQAYQIAESVPGIDIIFMGHTHRKTPEAFVNGVLLTNAGQWAENLARVDVELERSSDERWKMVAKHSQVIPVGDSVVADPEILDIAKPYHEETQKWLSTAIGETPVALDGRDARFRDTAIIDLIHRVQMDVGKADVSMAAMFNPSVHIDAGLVTVRQIASLYIYENTLVVLEITGQQLKQALEHSAEYFQTYRAGATPAQLINMQMPGFNFDMAEGVNYDIDLRRPVGDRVVNLTYQGKPVRPDQKFRLATNNYRVNGGGGFTMYRNAPVVYKSSQEIRNLIIEWVRQHRVIPAEPSHNWRLLPFDEEKRQSMSHEGTKPRFFLGVFVPLWPRDYPSRLICNNT
ncbi:MAG: bifunctional metallophosphatase/5'-nucleotidase [Acidobacteria bacterium]|nr:bifunctional metallophosphatase/5'-nucleotidase [Acidobacteriota bacterium]